MNTQTNARHLEQGNGRIPQWASTVLLSGVGVTLGIGYLLHLAGFHGWMTLTIAGMTLFVAGALWGNVKRFVLLATAVALVGALMCSMALPTQFQTQQTAAGIINLGIILSQLAVVVLIFTSGASPLSPNAQS